IRRGNWTDQIPHEHAHERPGEKPGTQAPVSADCRPGARADPKWRLPRRQSPATRKRPGAAVGVSRPSLREALIALEIEGSVEIRMGSGVYVCARALRRPALSIPMGESPAELMQARGVVEGSVIVLACVNATPEGLARVRESIEGMRADIAAGRDVLAHDREFHVRIAEMAGNSVLTALISTLFDERQRPLASH